MPTAAVSSQPVVKRPRYNGQKPDFFIVGAPRSGTTAMFHYLSAHPEIWMSDRKEMHHFGSDLNFGPQLYRRGLQALLGEDGRRNGGRSARGPPGWYRSCEK